MTPYQIERMASVLEDGKMVSCGAWLIVPHHSGLDKSYSVIQPDTGKVAAYRNINDVTWLLQDKADFEIVNRFNIAKAIEVDGNNHTKYGRDEFMEFFRSDSFHEQMSPDDCQEVFSQVLHGESDFTKELLASTATDYGVSIPELFNLVEKNDESILNDEEYLYFLIDREQMAEHGIVFGDNIHQIAKALKVEDDIVYMDDLINKFPYVTGQTDEFSPFKAGYGTVIVWDGTAGEPYAIRFGEFSQCVPESKMPLTDEALLPKEQITAIAETAQGTNTLKTAVSQLKRSSGSPHATPIN